ncbi:protein kinase [Nannocystis sp. RBIL2]|uniref:protein kinase domain-containing protein n=1 Tax=Nannocystis sp. RBIL2 TaxID=2996788 RepID=UPI0022712645|nr:protein kinase [Nannocystis sp. RBIL2]MCY1070920.1 protein kinase [Nannocystis sp. RBIL2]
MSLRTPNDRPGGEAGDDEPAVEPRRIGRFALLRRLGAGAMGVVYAAYDPQLDRKVAVKLLKRGDGEPNTRWQDRLLREAQALAKLSHPNVVQIHEVGFHGDEVFVAMEFVTGMTLRTWLSEQRRGWREVAAVFAQAARGLAAAHAAGLVHRDVKPDNVLVGSDGRVRVVDFGLVRFGDEDDDEHTDEVPLARAQATRTASGILLGTPAYMSPEQFRGRPADALSDQFSLCVALYEALHGERPFAGETADEVAQAVVRGQLAPRLERPVPTWLQRLVLRGLAHDPGARWPNLDVLAAELARDHGRRRRVLALAVAATAALAAAIVAVFWVSSWRDREARTQSEALAAGRLRAAEESIDEFLRAGRQADAAAVLDAFVAVPEHRTTRALADALRGWGDRMRARDDIPAARTAYARAYAAALDPAAERSILGDFVRLFHEQWSWDQLGTLCELLARQDPQGPWSGRCAEAAFARRDFHVVTAAHARSPGDPTLADLAPLAAAWAEATPLGHDVIGAGTLSAPGAAQRELYLHVDSPAPGRLDVVRPTPKLPVLRSYALPSRFAPRLRPLSLGPDKPPLLITWSATHRRVSLSAAGTERLAELVSVTADEPLGADVADLDGDGQQEVYVGTGPYGRVLLSFRPLSDGTWRIDHPHPETDATNSDISAVLAADLDGDGAQELALAAGPWRAFDVRVLRPGKGRTLELVARRKLGAVVGLATLRAADGERLLVAAKTDGYPSKIAFSASDPGGPPAGVYLLRLKGRELETVRFLPAPRRAGAAAPVDLHRLDVGDLDGDGLDDIILGVHDPELQPGFTVIHRQRTDGSFGVASLAGFRPVALVEVDGDPAAELVARTTVATLSQETWLLGAGAEATPMLQVARAPQSAPPPALTDRLLASAWQRAEQLAALDLSSEAARALDDLAGLLPDEPRAIARLRAAQLHEAAGDHLAAAERFEQLGEQTHALLGAAHAYEQAGRFADALRVARLLAERADLPRSEAAHVRDRVAQLAAIVEDVDVIALRFDQPLPSPWQIDDPTAAHQDLVGQHLQIDAFAGRGPIARLPFEWSTGPLGLQVDLVLERGEWGSGLVVGVRPLGSPTLLSAVRIDVSGGGGMFRRRHSCQVGGSEEYILTQEPGEDPARPSHLHFTLELLPELGQIACSAVVDGVRHERRTRLAADGLPPPGRYELVVMPSSFGTITGLWSSAKLRALTLRGARFGAAPTEEPPVAYAARLLVQGEAEAALAELERVEDEAPQPAIWRALALSELGRWAEATAALRPGLLDDPAARATLLGLMRARRQTIAPLVRAAYGPGYFRLFWDAMSDVVRHHGDPLIERALTTALSDLGEFRPAAGDVEGHVLKVTLLFERGRAWGALRQEQRARVDLAAAAALAELLPPARRTDLDIDYERAALEAVSGRRDAAREFAARALLRAPSRELMADRIRFDPRFAALVDDPAWLELLKG